MMGEMPLNAVQLGEVLEHPDQYEDSLQYLSFLEEDAGGTYYNDWIQEYLYFFNVSMYKSENNTLQETSIMLTPTDAEAPTVFQIKYPLEMDHYTHSVPAFYPAVKR